MIFIALTSFGNGNRSKNVRNYSVDRKPIVTQAVPGAICYHPIKNDLKDPKYFSRSKFILFLTPTRAYTVLFHN